MRESNRVVGQGEHQQTQRNPIWWLAICGLSVLLIVGLFGLPAVETATANTTNSGTADGEAGVDAEFTADEVELGTEDTVEVEVSNDDGEIGLTFGDDPPQEVEARLLRAEGTEVELTGTPAGVEVRTDSQRIGDLEDGESETVPFQIYVDEDEFDPGEEFDLDIEVSYTDIERVEYTLNSDGEVIGMSNERESDETDRFREGVEIEDEVQFEVIENISDVQIDDSGEFTVVMSNTGSEDATDVVVTVESDDNEVFFGSETPTASRSIDSWEAGETREVTFRAGTTDEALIEPYPIGVTVEYDDEDGDRQTEDEAETGQTALEPTDRQNYTVEDLTHEVQIGDDGIVEVELTNDGPQDITDAELALETADPDIAFGAAPEAETTSGSDEFPIEADGFDEDIDTGSPTAGAHIGDWNAGETVTVAFRMNVDENAVERSYPIAATITARDVNDNELQERDREFGFGPLPAQGFTIDNTKNTLRVGEDGDVVGSVTNDGEYTAENVVIQLAAEPSNVLPRNEQYAVGDLEPGETAEFNFRIGMSEEAEAGSKLLEFETRYRSDGDIRVDGTQDILVAVEPDRDSFNIQPVNATFEPGNSGTVEVELENNRDETITDVRAKLFPDDPLSSDDDEAFVTELEPGETEIVTFDVGVDSDVSAKEYPVSLDIRYDDERGDSQLSGTYQLPISVTEASESGFPLWVIAGPFVLVGGVLLYFRDRLSNGLSERFGSN